MTISEALLLVTWVGYMEAAGEVFVLDMGEPVKIMDRAKDIIIEISGSPPGEILFKSY